MMIEGYKVQKSELSCKNKRPILGNGNLSDRKMLKYHDLEFGAACFGFTRTKREYEGKAIGDLISLYIEDDESWYHVVDFDELWISDLQSVLQTAKFNKKAV